MTQNPPLLQDPHSPPLGISKGGRPLFLEAAGTLQPHGGGWQQSSLPVGWHEELGALGSPCFNVDGAVERSGIASAPLLGPCIPAASLGRAAHCAPHTSACSCRGTDPGTCPGDSHSSPLPNVWCYQPKPWLAHPSVWVLIWFLSCEFRLLSALYSWGLLHNVACFPPFLLLSV